MTCPSFLWMRRRRGSCGRCKRWASRSSPASIILRFRHPKAAPIKGVTVNGKEWSDFEQEKETITVKGLTGTVAVTAKY